jgi:hypothetical protein
MKMGAKGSAKPISRYIRGASEKIRLYTLNPITAPTIVSRRNFAKLLYRLTEKIGSTHPKSGIHGPKAVIIRADFVPNAIGILIKNFPTKYVTADNISLAKRNPKMICVMLNSRTGGLKSAHVTLFEPHARPNIIGKPVAVMKLPRRAWIEWKLAIVSTIHFG